MPLRANDRFQRLKRSLHGVADLLRVVAGPVQLEFKSFPDTVFVTQRSFYSDLFREQMRGQKAGPEFSKLFRVRLLRRAVIDEAEYFLFSEITAIVREGDLFW